MHTSTNKFRGITPHPGTVPEFTLYCKIFEDMIPGKVCELRKNELNNFSWFSCKGCTIGMKQGKKRLFHPVNAARAE